MTTAKKIVLAIAAVVIVGLLIFAGVSGGALGTVKCLSCDGTGIVTDADCTHCDGDTHTVTCPTCNGMLKVGGKDCPECKGEGTVTCNYCKGTGTVAEAPCSECGGEGTHPGSAWALLPPIIAIGLALITKEVYSSLFVGIIVGGMLYSNFSFEGTLTHAFNDGIVASLADAYNVGILVFLVILGILVMLMNKAGGSAAFGRWASEHIKTRAGAQLATIALGVLIFIDDYFNCLTVGSVMRPVTDKSNISRAKLAYLIDATAAPVCIIAPVSSWAAAVSSVETRLKFDTNSAPSSTPANRET